MGLRALKLPDLATLATSDISVRLLASWQPCIST